MLKISFDRPAGECDPNSIHIGPTAVDFSVLTKRLEAPNERKLLEAWKTADLAQYYREQRSNYYR